MIACCFGIRLAPSQLGGELSRDSPPPSVRFDVARAQSVLSALGVAYPPLLALNDEQPAAISARVSHDIGGVRPFWNVRNREPLAYVAIVPTPLFLSGFCVICLLVALRSWICPPGTYLGNKKGASRLRSSLLVCAVVCYAPLG